MASATGSGPHHVERYPYAGGPDHRVGYPVDRDGFEVELVADGS